MRLLANRKLAVRLGVAFGTLVVGLLIVTLIGYAKIGSLRGDTQDLAATKLRATAIAGELARALSEAESDIVSHLYVYDGDLKAQDAIAKERNAETPAIVAQ